MNPFRAIALVRHSATAVVAVAAAAIAAVTAWRHIKRAPEAPSRRQLPPK